MKKYRLKLTTLEFRFLQSILIRLAEAYKNNLPDNIAHQILIELYESRFNVSVVDQNLEKTLVLNRSVVLAFHQFLNEIPLSGDADLLRNQLFNQFDVFLQG
ncbi:hypothetical protein [Flammeovirga sp. EKP202]|uniref:hypothetical protein n=1 Tax=Flammeovirga sp. EKP202 TaxID=2770592 RepID=UPI00165F9993|nr:hypothetical protein [Flammeovirga sp. EKP202]MBD0404648.1 hypothetical protein [Flammeovirga sp. EKP202]